MFIIIIKKNKQLKEINNKLKLTQCEMTKTINHINTKLTIYVKKI